MTATGKSLKLERIISFKYHSFFDEVLELCGS